MYFVCVRVREHERVCVYMFIYTVLAGSAGLPRVFGLMDFVCGYVRMCIYKYGCMYIHIYIYIYT